MNGIEWLRLATRFDLGQCRHYQRPVLIEAREQRDGSKLWVLKMHDWVLGKDGEFYLEPQPSSRTDEFIALTRFDSFSGLRLHWLKSVTGAKKLYLHGTREDAS